MNHDEAQTAVVRGEDAAVYAYSIAGPRVPAQRRALSALDAHRQARDLAAATLSAPPPPASAYALPIQPDTPTHARELLAHVENALVPVYADLAAVTTGDARRRAVIAAQVCASRAVSWGALTQAFPQGQVGSQK